jgi:TolB protein
MRFVLICLLPVLLCACATPAPDAAPTSAARLPVTPPSAQSNAPQPTIIAAGARLPGRLLFVRDGNVWLWQEQTGRPLTSDGAALHPTWSPDGTRIVFVQRDQSFSDLIVLPLDGGRPLRLTDHGSSRPRNSFERIRESIWAFYPSFAPDGQTIAFASQYGPPSGSPAAEYHLALFTIPAQAGGSRRLIYANDTGHVGRVTHTPDGSAIVFAFEPATTGGASQILRYDRATGATIPLPGVPPQSYDPTLSPDGRWLAFAGRDGARTDIFAVPTSGGTVVRLTSIGAARAPAFAPDGRMIAFLAVAPGEIGFDLWVADLRIIDNRLQASTPQQVSIGLRADADSGLSWGK